MEKNTKKSSTSTKKSTKKKPSLTILNAMRTIRSKQMKTDTLVIPVDANVRKVMSWGKISKEQACILSYFAIMTINDNDWYSVADIQNYLEVDYEDFIGYMSDFDALLLRGFFSLRFDIAYTKGAFNKYTQFYMPESIEEQICYNRKFEPYFPDPTNEPNDVLSYIFRTKRESLSRPDYYFKIIEAFYKDDPFLKRFIENKHGSLYGMNTTIALNFFTTAAVNLIDSGEVSLKEMLACVEPNSPTWVVQVMKEFKAGESDFLKENIFKIEKDNIGDNIKLLWGSAALEKIFRGEAELFIKGAEVKELGRVSHKDIKEKELYYNEENLKDIERLKGLCEESKYNEMRNRLEEKAMPKGLIVLLYGAPGTGKTETVMQLARSTERDLFHVNIEEIRSCWVGESEKNIKKVFDAYRQHKSDKKPILLFNEADAIVSKRTQIENGNAAVTKMENAIQNIILEEMENFDGIMILTTNLEQQLDEAFDRRILFKLKFENPKPEVSKKIWKNKIETLSDEQAYKLSSEYNFSGAQIENIRRKIALEEILYGETPSFETISEFCKKERLFGNDCNHHKLGFVSDN